MPIGILEWLGKNTKSRVYSNFIGGMRLRGLVALSNTNLESVFPAEGYLAYVEGLVSETGLLAPGYGFSEWSASVVGAINNDTDLLHGYIPGDSRTPNSVLIARNNAMQRLTIGGAASAAGTIGGAGTFRPTAQYRDYVFIAGHKLPLLRYRRRETGAAAELLSYAGTPPPDYSGGLPSKAAAGGGALSTFGYEWKHFFRYGRNGDLGMGYVSIGTLAVTAGQRVNIGTGGWGGAVPLQTTAPTNYDDLYSSGLARNTPNYPTRFFIITESTTPPTGFADTLSDTFIEGGGELDPEDGTAGLPPIGAYIAFHDGRLWIFSLSSLIPGGGSNYELYPNEYAHSRYSGVDALPRPSQFDEFARGPVSDGSWGAITGAYTFGGNLYCTMEHAIAYLSTRPVEGGSTQVGTPAGWTILSPGVGCVAPRSQSSCRWGRFMVSSEGPILLRGGNEVERIWSNMTGAESPSSFSSAIGGFDPYTQTYIVRIGTNLYQYDVLRGSWRVLKISMGVPPTIFAQHSGRLLFDGKTNNAGIGDRLFVFGGGTRGTWLSGDGYAPQFRTDFDDCGYPNRVKKVKYVNIYFASKSNVTTATGTVHFDGDVTKAADITFSGGTSSGLVLQGKINGKVKPFETIQVRCLPAAHATATIAQVEIVFDVFPDRWWNN